MKESYSEEMGKRVGLSKFIKRSNLEAVDNHLEDQEDAFKWKSRVLESLFNITNKDSENRIIGIYDMILNMAHNHIKTYNKQIEDQEKEINESSQEVIKDVLISRINVLKEQRTFYNKICEEFYNLSEDEIQSNKSISDLIRKMHNDLKLEYKTKRGNDTIATQIDNERIVDPTDDSKYLHLN